MRVRVCTYILTKQEVTYFVIISFYYPKVSECVKDVHYWPYTFVGIFSFSLGCS